MPGKRGARQLPVVNINDAKAALLERGSHHGANRWVVISDDNSLALVTSIDHAAISVL